MLGGGFDMFSRCFNMISKFEFRVIGEDRKVTEHSIGDWDHLLEESEMKKDLNEICSKYSDQPELLDAIKTLVLEKIYKFNILKNIEGFPNLKICRITLNPKKHINMDMLDDLHPIRFLDIIHLDDDLFSSTIFKDNGRKILPNNIKLCQVFSNNHLEKRENITPFSLEEGNPDLSVILFKTKFINNSKKKNKNRYILTKLSNGEIIYSGKYKPSRINSAGYFTINDYKKIKVYRLFKSGDGVLKCEKVLSTGVPKLSYIMLDGSFLVYDSKTNVIFISLDKNKFTKTYRFEKDLTFVRHDIQLNRKPFNCEICLESNDELEQISNYKEILKVDIENFKEYPQLFKFLKIVILEKYFNYTLSTYTTESFEIGMSDTTELLMNIGTQNKLISINIDDFGEVKNVINSDFKKIGVYHLNNTTLYSGMVYCDEDDTKFSHSNKNIEEDRLVERCVIMDSNLNILANNELFRDVLNIITDNIFAVEDLDGNEKIINREGEHIPYLKYGYFSFSESININDDYFRKLSSDNECVAYGIGIDAIPNNLNLKENVSINDFMNSIL